MSLLSQNSRFLSMYLRHGDKMLGNLSEALSGKSWIDKGAESYELVRHAGMVWQFKNSQDWRIMWKKDGRPYSIPFSKSRFVPSLLISHHGATLPRGGIPLLNSVISLKVRSRISFCCSTDIATGFS